MTTSAGTADAAFEAAVDEFLARTRELVDLESTEDVPPAIPPATGTQPPAPVPSALVLDAETIRAYALSIGDDNPLFTDEAYAAASCHGGLVAPGPILVHARYPADHGAGRPGGYPVANFIGGVAWEFFDVVRAGTRVSTTKALREVIERRGVGGRRLIHLVCEVGYVDALDRPLAKAYGTLIQVPVRSMGTSRAMPVELLGEELLSDRRTHRYSPDEVEDIVAGMAAERRRGDRPLYWEDVEVGSDLPPIVQPPYALHDTLSYQSLHQGVSAGHGGGLLARSFTPAYRRHRAGVGYPDGARVHPVTRWPYTPGDEHEDAVLCAYRAQPLPFDFGIQRAQIPQRLVGNWAGDHGFCRKLHMTTRRPLFHGDAFVLRGRVADRYVVRDPAPDGPVRHAVRVVLDGVNQRGESVSRGNATVYLPSREAGDVGDGGGVMLPLGHETLPPYVPFERHRSASWY